jgi:DNA-binding GntR family transcriptional regulator
MNEPISRANLGESVYRQLWEGILARRLQPGDKLSDLQISRELGVSRTPVREALQRLVSDGIVRAEPNHGFFIAAFSRRDIAEIYDLRAALEATALKHAAPHLSMSELTAELDVFEAIGRIVKQSADDDEWLQATKQFLEVDRSFHRRLAELAGNARLRAMLEGLWAQIAVFQRAGLFRRSWLDVALRDHRAVIDALIAGEVNAAAGHLEAHIDHVKRLVLDLAETSDLD